MITLCEDNECEIKPALGNSRLTSGCPYTGFLSTQTSASEHRRRPLCEQCSAAASHETAMNSYASLTSERGRGGHDDRSTGDGGGDG